VPIKATRLTRSRMPDGVASGHIKLVGNGNVATLNLDIKMYVKSILDFQDFIQKRNRNVYYLTNFFILINA